MWLKAHKHPINFRSKWNLLTCRPLDKITNEANCHARNKHCFPNCRQVQLFKSTVFAQWFNLRRRVNHFIQGWIDGLLSVQPLSDLNNAGHVVVFIRGQCVALREEDISLRFWSLVNWIKTQGLRTAPSRQWNGKITAHERHGGAGYVLQQMILGEQSPKFRGGSIVLEWRRIQYFVGNRLRKFNNIQNTVQKWNWKN